MAFKNNTYNFIILKFISILQNDKFDYTMYIHLSALQMDINE